jgi:hypothetical protein
MFFFEKSSGNVFADIGFTPTEAAWLRGEDQPMISKVFRGRMESVTIDRLASWLNALWRDVEIMRSE